MNKAIVRIIGAAMLVAFALLAAHLSRRPAQQEPAPEEIEHVSSNTNNLIIVRMHGIKASVK